LVVCPKCGSPIQARKIIVLSNRNAITCNVCSSRLRVKNKGINSIIGAVGGGLGGGLGTLTLWSYLRASNLAYLALTMLIFLTIFLISFILVDKYIILQVVNRKVTVAQN
jgi:DNA-directed RNA polymerase subunit RPC12/RpoP